MKNLALLILAVSAIALQGCSSGGKSSPPGTSSSPSPSSVASSASSASEPGGVDKPDEGSSSSSSSAGEDPAVVSGRVLFATQCSACHADNGDGTFDAALVGPAFDVNSFTYPDSETYPGYSADTVEGLALFIHDTMPTATACIDDCATDVAAYLWSFREDGGSSSSDPVTSSSSSESSSSTSVPPVDGGSSSSDGGGASSSAPGEPVGSSSSSAGEDPAVVSGKMLFATQCSVCHADNGDGTFDAALIGPAFDVNSFTYPDSETYPGYSADTVEGLALFIHDTMPSADACIDDCATDVAAYLWSLREGSDPGTPPASSSSSSSDPGTPPASSSSSSSDPDTPPVSSSSSSSQSPEESTSGIAGGKAFIDRLNGLVGAVERATNDKVSPSTGYLADFLGAEVAAQLDDFLKQVEESGITGSDLEAILTALGSVGTAVAEVLAGSISGDPIPTNVGGVAIGFADQSGVKTFTVSDNVNGCSDGVCNVAVDFTMVMEFERNATGGEAGNVTTLASSGRPLDITATGTFASGGVELSFNDVAGSNISMDELYLEMVEGEDITEVYFELPGLVINLPITLANNSVSVDANVQGSAAMVELELVLAADTEISVLEVTDLALNASVVLANTTGDSVTADLLLDSDGTSSDYTYVITEAGVLEIDGETAQSFMGLVGSLDVNAILTGASPISLSGNIERISSELISFNGVTIEHSGSDVTLSGIFNTDGDIVELTAVDEEGYILSVEARSGGSLSGTMQNTEGAVIGNVGGVIGKGTVTFTDGSTKGF